MSDRGPRRKAIRFKAPSVGDISSNERASSGSASGYSQWTDEEYSSNGDESDSDAESDSGSENHSEYDELSDRLSDEQFDPSTATDEEYSYVPPRQRGPDLARQVTRGHVHVPPPMPPRPPFRRSHSPQYYDHRGRPLDFSRRHYGAYVKPFRVEDPSSSLSAVVSLRGMSTRPRMPGAHQPAARSWEAAKSTLPTDGKTDCLTIREVNHYADEAGDSLITLVCYNTASATKKESVQTRWMHLHQDPNMADFEDLIDSCPHADPTLRTVALALLRDRRHSTNSQPFQGELGSRDFITRYDHRDHRGQWSTESVVFISVPFFTRKTRAWLNSAETTPTSATPVRYHVHPDHDFAAADAQIASGGSLMSGGDTTSEVCVAYLWCLLLGPDIIVTCGDIELKDLLGSSMTVEMKSRGTRRPCAIRITDSDSRYFHLVIDPPLSYFEFMECVVNKVRLFADGSHVKGFKLFTEDDEELTPETWLGLMQREELDSLSLVLHRREGFNYTSESDASSDESSSLKSYEKYEREVGRARGPVVVVAPNARHSSRAGSGARRSPSLVVNDTQSLPGARSRVFQATIESDDSEPETTRSISERASSRRDNLRKPSMGSSRSSNLQKSTASSQAQNQRVRKVGFASDTILPSYSTSTGSTACANGGSDDVVPLIIHPFFTWNVVHKRDGGGGNLPSHIQIYRLLNRVDKAMSRKRPTAHRYVYQRGFECGLSELGYRHPYLADIFRGADNATNTHRTAEITNASSGGNSGQHARSDASGLPFQNATDTLLWETVVEQYFRPLVTLSLDIGKGFVPAELEVVHRCWKKLWGAIDRILRCVEMHYKQAHAQGAYRVSERLYTASPYCGSWDDDTKGFILECQACKEVTQYQTVKQVLDHLHERHTQCQDCGKPARLFDDPCTVWVEGTMEVHDRTVQKSVSRTLRKLNLFILYLEDIQRCISELQRSVQHVDAPGARKQGEKKLPLLPSTLVRGFEELLLSYITLAHVLSRSTAGCEIGEAPGTTKPPKARRPKGVVGDSRDTRSSRTYGSSYVPSSYAAKGYGAAQSTTGTFEIPQIHRQSMAQAKLRFKHARRDLILLSTTTSQAGSVSLTAVGAEYILGVVLAGLNTHMDGKKEDLLSMYSRQLVRVANQAARRPQRRHFMELHALETNVVAVERVFRLHAHLLGNYGRILDPMSYRVTTKARQALYEVEANFLSDEAKRLVSRSRLAEGLLNRLDFFQQRIKQQIEVLEEGHGKAIRVFTFVTAFFLPLSFVTSFLGMNTTDIRDTDLDQSIFWKVAIPTTILILTLAFLYGYKWDSIHDSLSNTWETAQQKRAQRRARHRAERDGGGGGDGSRASRWSFSGTRLGQRGERGARSGEKDAYGLNGLPV